MIEYLGEPIAYAILKGNSNNSMISGRVEFYETYGGTIVAGEISGISADQNMSDGFHGFHIHTGGDCSGTIEEPFWNVGSHYNSKQTNHPNHAGDLPPILANAGEAMFVFFTGRFYPEEIIGRAIVLHDKADDFKTQPSGDAGSMIACGEIKDYINTMNLYH